MDEEQQPVANDPIRLNALAYACGIAGHIAPQLEAETAGETVVKIAEHFDAFLRGKSVSE